MRPGFDCAVPEEDTQGTPFLRACPSESSPRRLVGEQWCPRNILAAGVPFYLDVLRLGPEESFPN